MIEHQNKEIINTKIEYKRTCTNDININSECNNPTEKKIGQ